MILHATAGALVAAVSSPAVAQDAAAAPDPGGGAIVVTPRRREENLQDVPISISVVNEGVLQRTGS